VIESLAVPATHPPRVRLGIVGGGLISQVAHLPVLARLHELFRVESLADPSARVREALQARWDIPRTFPDHRGLIERGGIDAVVVCSPNATHAPVVLDALEAGVDVLVEKPLCLAPADADAIVASARERGRIVQVGYMKRFDPAYERLLGDPPPAERLLRVESTTVDPGIARTLRPAGFVEPTEVAADALADLTALQVAEAVGSGDPAHHRPYSEAFLGALVHDVNAVLGLLDAMGLEVERVVDAAGAADGTLASSVLELSGGVRWSAAWLLAPGAPAFTEDIRLLTADGARALSFAAPYLDPVATYSRELEHFHACVRSREPCRAPAEQGARDVRLLSEVFRATLDRPAALAP
jgi:Oxidoreductase family, NAD-binding Rossmann fold